MTTIGSRRPAGPRRVLEWPVTRSGRWGAALVAAAVFLWLVVEPITGWLGHPTGGSLGAVAALAGGALAIHAIVRNGERSLALLATLVPWLVVAVFVVGEVVRGD